MWVGKINSCKMKSVENNCPKCRCPSRKWNDWQLEESYSDGKVRILFSWVQNSSYKHYLLGSKMLWLEHYSPSWEKWKENQKWKQNKQVRFISLQVNSEKSLNWVGYDSQMEEKPSSWGVKKEKTSWNMQEVHKLSK